MDKSMEAQNLTSILCAYKELSANPLCEKIIRESGLCVPSLMKYGEYLFIPLQLESYPSSTNRFGVYSLRFQQPDIIDTVVLQTEAYAYTILHNIICNDQNQESNQFCLNMWGCLKNNYTDAPIDRSFFDHYQKLMYLYSSMISTRIIRTNSSLMRDAFLLTVWDFSYRIIIQQNNTYIETVNDAISSLKTNGNNPRYSHLLTEMQAKDFDVDHFDQQFAIKLLYEMFDYDRNSIISFISGDTYHYRHNTLYSDAYKNSSKIVDIVIENCKQRAYINSLLYRENRPRIDINTIDSMNPYVFEKLIALIFQKMGYEAYATKASGDQGIDVIAKKGNRMVAIQAKCYSNPVGNAAIQEAVAGKAFYHADEACVITNSSFTKSAYELARANNVTLWDRAALSNRLNDLNIYSDEI